MALRCVVVEDQVMFLQLLVAMLHTQPRLEVVATARGVDEAIAVCAEHSPDLLILDLALPDGDALRNAVEATVRPSLDRRLRFTVGYPSPLAFLRELRQLGVQGQASGRLQAGAMRRLLRHWPADDHGRTLLTWELRLLLAQRP